MQEEEKATEDGQAPEVVEGNEGEEACPGCGGEQCECALTQRSICACDVIEAENIRLRAELKQARRQIEELKAQQPGGRYALGIPITSVK